MTIKLRELLPQIQSHVFTLLKIVQFSVSSVVMLVGKTRDIFSKRNIKQNPKPMLIYSYALSRASRLLHMFTSIFDWFVSLYVISLIGQTNYFGSGCTTPK